MATSPHILIVEADRLQRNFLCLLVTQCIPTARVTAVASGYDTLVAYQNDKADLLILDHSLPDVLGSAFLQYLRDRGVTIPTILMTEAVAREALLPETRTYLLSKPLKLMEFMTMLTHALEPIESKMVAA